MPQATNISGMDVGPCRVVVCSADFAWYYNVRQGSNTSRQRPQEPRDSTGGGGQKGGGVAPESIVGSSSGAARSSRTLRGFQLPSSRVTEARFSEDGERCFFGTVSGHIFIVSGMGPGLLVARNFALITWAIISTCYHKCMCACTKGAICRISPCPYFFYILGAGYRRFAYTVTSFVFFILPFLSLSFLSDVCIFLYHLLAPLVS